jgi:hypothetical protein
MAAKSKAAPRRAAAAPSVEKHLITALEHAHRVKTPFDYWLLQDVLPKKMIDGIASLPFPPPKNPVFNGRRESNNSTRVYFTQDNQRKFPICRDVAALFSDADVLSKLHHLTHADLSKGQLRIEYCQDIDGFWLEPHLDISVKLFTMLVYLSDDPQLFDAGTDIYDSSPEHRLVATAPYEQNTGLIFIPGKNTWHGFTKRPLHGLRKSVIINFVSPEWMNKDELAYY